MAAISRGFQHPGDDEVRQAFRRFADAMVETVYVFTRQVAPLARPPRQKAVGLTAPVYERGRW